MPETKEKKFQLLMLDVDPKTGEPRTRPVTEVLREDANLFGGKASVIFSPLAKFVEAYESGWNKVYGTKIGKKFMDKAVPLKEKFDLKMYPEYKKPSKEDRSTRNKSGLMDSDKLDDK